MPDSYTDTTKSESITSFQPHYRRIYEDIERRILDGELSFGTQLPLLPELCVEYGVSEAPIRRALDELSRVGLIVRQRGRGKGTFVSKRIAPPTFLRVLLLGFDLSRSVIESYHEIYGLLEGIRTAAARRDCTVQTIGEDALANLAPAPPGTRVGYLVLSNFTAKYSNGCAIASAENAPCVLINTPGPVANTHTTSADIEHGAFLGTKHLLELGHRRVAYIGRTSGGWFAPRLSGYTRALLAHDLEIDETLIRETSGLIAGEDAGVLDQLLALPEPPTAIFAGSDYRALHLMNHAQNRLRLSIPEDLSICGYDNISACETVSPTLTSVYHPLQEQGEAAVEILVAAMEDASVASGQARLLPPSLVVRASTAPPRFPA